MIAFNEPIKIDRYSYPEEYVRELEKENAELKFKNKVLLGGIRAYKKLNTCYRLGGNPPEYVWRDLDKLNKFVSELKE